MRTIIMASSMIFILLCCAQPDRITFDPNAYFGTLAIEESTDEDIKKEMENLLKQLNEPPLVDSVSGKSFFRLIVDPSFTNAYCVRLVKDTGRISVTYKVVGDKEGREINFGLSNLTMTYDGESKNTDSLFALFKQALVKSDIHSWTNNYDISPVADGTFLLMEIVDKGQRKVIFRCYGSDKDFKRMYENANEFLEIKQRMESFVPNCLFQRNFHESRNERDFLFNIFQHH